MSSQPIHVNGDMTLEAVLVAVRVVVIALSPLLAYYGLASEELVVMWGAAIAGVVTAAWAVWRTLRKHAQLVRLAEQVPDEVAVVD